MTSEENEKQIIALLKEISAKLDGVNRNLENIQSRQI